MVFGGRLAACGDEPQDAEQEPSGKQKDRKQKVKEEPSCAGLCSGLIDSILCLRMISLKAEE